MRTITFWLWPSIAAAGVLLFSVAAICQLCAVRERRLDDEREPAVLVRGAPPLPTSEAEPEPPVSPREDGASMARDLVELGRQQERLEREIREANRVLYFVNCLENRTGIHFSKDRPFDPKILKSKASKACRAETLEAENRPDFNTVCAAIVNEGAKR